MDEKQMYQTLRDAVLEHIEAHEDKKESVFEVIGGAISDERESRLMEKAKGTVMDGGKRSDVVKAVLQECETFPEAIAYMWHAAEATQSFIHKAKQLAGMLKELKEQIEDHE